MTDAKPRSLYVHVPFCRTICAYCDFRRYVYRSEAADAWLKAVEKELQAREVFHPETIYIGGGTPSALNDDQLETLLSLLDPFAEEVKEYTAEVNPETVREGLAERLARHSVNRISAGFQSSSKRLLKLMNRHHTEKDMERLFASFHQAGITNISLDLMYSLPSQTSSELQEAVETAVSYGPTHLSLYSLTIEENSVFGKKGLKPCDEDTEADMYEWIAERLRQCGYRQYEVSSFEREGHSSLHNCNVWNYHDFAGIGYGAWGMEQGIRYTHSETLKGYLQDPLCHKDVNLSEREQMFESLMMGLRLVEGLDRRLFLERFDQDPVSVYPSCMERFRKEGLMDWNEERVFCTGKGYMIMNNLLEEILEEADL